MCNSDVGKASRIFVEAGLATILLLCGSSALAQGGAISVCVKTSDGAMRMILNGSSNPSCSAGERLVQWSSQGARGPQGPQGTAGPQGPQGVAGRSGPPGQDCDCHTGGNGNTGGRGSGTGTGGTSADNGQGSSKIVYAPFQVKSKATGKVLFEVVEDVNGGTARVFSSGGAKVAEMKADSYQGSGAVVAWSLDQNSQAAMGFGDSSIGRFQLISNGVRTAELAPGSRSPMGFRLFNGAGLEVISLEVMPDGNGGLKIGNSRGGTAATIVPNKDGVGVFHGIAVPLIP